MKKTITAWLFFLSAVCLRAQEDNENIFSFEISNTAELQYNFTNGDESNPKFVNQAVLEAALSTRNWWRNGVFRAGFWSVAASFDRSIMDDMLTFSDIEESTSWLLCAVLGYEHTFGNVKVFGGIRTINLDYFASPYSSVFTNSSAGLFPTISLNYSVADYPLSGMAFHAEYNYKAWSIKNSFYNNLESFNEKTVFKVRFDPAHYGFNNFTQVQYSSATGIYALGMVLNKTPHQSLRYSPYMLVEQQIAQSGNRKLGTLIQLGYAPKEDNYCYAYYGGGLVVSGLFNSKGKDTIGMIAYRANTADRNETGIEFTYSYDFGNCFSLQPAIHYINNDTEQAWTGLIRGTITLGR